MKHDNIAYRSKLIVTRHPDDVDLSLAIIMIYVIDVPIESRFDNMWVHGALYGCMVTAMIPLIIWPSYPMIA
jgi:hypothetical protein